MHWTGLLVGAAAFAIIGLFHPIVIKCEYYFTARAWPVFLLGGLAFLALALFTRHTAASCILSVLGFTCLWSIGELKEQKERVEKGWFPRNPNRK